MAANQQQQEQHHQQSSQGRGGPSMPPGFDPAVWQQFWNQMTSNMMSATSAAGGDRSRSAPPGSFDPGDIARQMQNAFLDAMANWCDEYLRSPQFLDMMKKSLDTSLAMRRELEEFMRKASGNAFGDSLASGIDPAGIIQAAEERMTEKLEEISDRLDAIEQELGAGARPRSARANTTSPTARPSAPDTGRKKSKTKTKSTGASKKAGKKKTKKKTTTRRKSK